MSQRKVNPLRDCEAAANLRYLLYGLDNPLKCGSTSSPGDESQNLGDINNFLANFDKACEFEYEDRNGSESTLIKKQDHYIEQLEKENKIIKKQLETLQIKVHEVVNENKGLQQDKKSNLMHTMVPDSSTPMTSKGLSDEEKMFRGRNDAITNSNSNETELIRKIKQLESENLRLTEYQAINSIENLQLKLTSLQRENQNLSLKIGQLEDIISRFKEREDDAQNKIREGIVLVEQAQVEKFQAVVERDTIRESLDKQQSRFDSLLKDYEKKLEDEKQRQNKLFENQLKEHERELQVVNNTAAALQAEVDKSEREKLNFKQKLQRASSQLDNFQSEYQQNAEKYQEEVTRALLERNQAFENYAQIKMTNERMKLEHQKEVQWMRVEMDDYRKKMEGVSHDLFQSKSDLSKLQQQRKILEREFEYTKTAAERDKNATREDVDDMKKYSKLREDQLRTLTESIKEKYAARHVELETMLKKQIDLGKKFRAECRALDDKLQKLVEFHKVTTADYRRKSEVATEKLATSNRRCADLEKSLEQSQIDQIELKRKQSDMERKQSVQNDQIADLLSQQQLLLRERQLHHEELNFILGKLNQKSDGNVV